MISKPFIWKAGRKVVAIRRLTVVLKVYFWSNSWKARQYLPVQSTPMSLWFSGWSLNWPFGASTRICQSREFFCLIKIDSSLPTHPQPPSILRRTKLFFLLHRNNGAPFGDLVFPLCSQKLRTLALLGETWGFPVSKEALLQPGSDPSHESFYNAFPLLPASFANVMSLNWDWRGSNVRFQ